MQSCLEKDIAPFALAAWIHATFARIHPFTVSILWPHSLIRTEKRPQDGNGRVTRLLASLPLIRAGFPFINIRENRRDEYLEALFKVSFLWKQLFKWPEKTCF